MGRTRCPCIKKKRTLRFYDVYRRVGALTKRESYFIPHMDECIYSIDEGIAFFTLHANSKYCQVNIDEKYLDKTALTSHDGLYQFIWMSFGLQNTPETFQRTIDDILSSVKCQFYLEYQDDIVIFSKVPEQHIHHL